MLADTNGDGRFDASFRRQRLNSTHVYISLVTFSGKRLWAFSLPHVRILPDEDEPHPGIAGEVTGDGVPDYVFAARGHLDPPSRCGDFDEAWSQPIFVDGKTGSTASPLPSIRNKCWVFPTATYPTQRYVGFVQSGDFNTAYRGREVVVIPMYPPDDRGWVLNYERNGKWTKIEGQGGRNSLVFPSHPEFGAHYNAANPGAPCKFPFTFKHCDVPNSHVPGGLVINSEGWRGLFTLTSGRALIYRYDLTPTADTVWSSGDTPNGGRNYGLSLYYSHEGRDYVSLIGGCSVRVARESMHSGEAPGGRLDTSLGSVAAHCGIHHHYEWFEVDGPRITRHHNEYYSYSSSDGFFHGRPEFIANPLAPIGGVGSNWLAYNLYNAAADSTGDGQWQIELRPDPADPTNVIHKPGWYVWDTTDLDGDGRAELLATRAPANGYVLPWEMDVLKWNGTDLESVAHRDGFAPSLFRYPNNATRFDGGARREGALTRDVDGDGVREVMVEDEAGERSFLRVNGL